MKSLNKSMLIGYVGADPEVRYTAADPKKAVANFTIATTERWREGEELREDTQWHKCVAWGRLGELAGELLVKGSPVYVEGRLKTRPWKDRDNVERFTTEIVLDDFSALSGAATAKDEQQDEKRLEPRRQSSNGEKKSSQRRDAVGVRSRVR